MPRGDQKGRGRQSPGAGRPRGWSPAQAASPEDEDAEEDEGYAQHGDYQLDEEYTAVGEEYEEVDNSEDELQADKDQHILQEACLPVSGAPLPPSEGPPKDADEYLRQVQWERLQCPEVVDVEVKDRSLERRKKHGGPLTGKEGRGGLLSLFNAPEVPTEMGHSSKWAGDVAKCFRVLRTQCARARRAIPEDQVKSLGYEEWRRHVSRDRPSTELVAAQDFVSLNHLLVVSVDKIEAEYDSFSSCAEEADSGRAPTLNHDSLDATVEWANAALAFLEEPLVDDIQFQMQRLRRICQRLLALVHERQANKAASEVPENGEVAFCHDVIFVRARICLLLVLVGDVFGQH